MRKYELIGEPNAKGLRRICALRPFLGAAKGEIGGWVESETNLSHTGDCWISHEAQVYGEAQVFDDAQIYGRARVHGEAKVFGSARVFNDAQVFDGARVYELAEIYGKAHVYGGAAVFGLAHICGDAQVYDGAVVWGQARVFGEARVYENAVLRVGYFTRPGIGWTPRVIVGTRDPVCESSDGYVQIGCRCLHISDWLDGYRDIGVAEGYTKLEIKEYKEYINMFARLYGQEGLL